MLPVRAHTLALATLRRTLAPAGIDIIEALSAESYNARVVPLDPALSVPLLNDGDGTTLMIMIGNSRAVWEPFLSWCRHNWFNNTAHDWQDKDTLSSRGIYDGHEHSGLMSRGFHPFDDFITNKVAEAVELTRYTLEASGEGLSTRTYYSYDTSPGKLLAAQHAAAAAGVAYVEPVSHLSLHPKFGPWWSIRAAIVCSIPGPSADQVTQEGGGEGEGSKERRPHHEDVHITPEQRERVQAAAARAMAEAPMYNGTYTGR
jgi:hypothetical protein